jgi:hypothetical protein
MEIKPIHKAFCHCGSIEFEVKLPNGLEDACRCDCSICSKRGSIMASVKLDDLKVIKGKEILTLYQFNTMTAKHYFCSKCGIYTHHQRRSDPNQYSFNIACLENINPFELGEVPTYDGINHPSDR